MQTITKTPQQSKNLKFYLNYNIFFTKLQAMNQQLKYYFVPFLVS